MLTILSGAVLRYLDVNPITSRELPSEIEIRGALPTVTRNSAVTLLIDDEAIAASAKSRSFQALDLSFGWLSPLEAEFGPVAIERVSSPGAAHAGAWVVTCSAVRRGLARAQDVLRDGGTVLVELGGLPSEETAPWLELAKLHSDAASASVELRHALPPGVLRSQDQVAFESGPAPRPTGALSLAPTDPSTIALGEGDRSFFFRTTVGNGTLIVVAFDVGRWFATMLQGRPTKDDFTVTETHGDYPDRIEPDDLIEDPRLRENELPFADLAAHAIASLLDAPGRTPLPRILWWPKDSRGTFLMTHDEDLRGGKAMLDLAHRDQARGIRGTHFVVGHPRILESAIDWPRSAEFARRIALADGALTVHWNQLPTPHGALRIEPIQWVATLEEQLAWLASALPSDEGFDRTINRNHFLMLRPHWSSTYRILAAQGVVLDSTLAANKGRGFLFGTARPYRLLDDNGLPLPIRELPFQAQEDWGGADASFFERLFRRNAESDHGALVTIFHPPNVLKTPTPEELIDRVRALSTETGHRSWTMPQFLEFCERRIAADLEIREMTASRLRFRISVASDDACIGLPLHRSNMVTCLVDGKSTAITLESVAGVPYARIAVPRGDHEVLADFAGN